MLKQKSTDNEQRRIGRLKLAKYAEAKRSKIGDLLRYIEKHLAELEKVVVVVVVKEFQNMDRERQCRRMRYVRGRICCLFRVSWLRSIRDWMKLLLARRTSTSEYPFFI